MNIEDDVIRFDYEWREGDRALAKQIAKEYVNRNRVLLQQKLGKYTLEDIVAIIDGYRDAGRHTERIIADMWLMSEYDPQNISGAINIGTADVLAAAEEALRRGQKE